MSQELLAYIYKKEKQFFFCPSFMAIDKTALANSSQPFLGMNCNGVWKVVKYLPDVSEIIYSLFGDVGLPYKGGRFAAAGPHAVQNRRDSHQIQLPSKRVLLEGGFLREHKGPSSLREQLMKKKKRRKKS
jgi:hypothetical protein